MSEKPEALRLADEYTQEVKDFGYVENSYVRAKLKNRLACLHAECEALRARAARYDWLRRWKGQEHEPPFTVRHELDGTLWGGDLDAAIDAAMEQT